MRGLLEDAGKPSDFGLIRTILRQCVQCLPSFTQVGIGPDVLRMTSEQFRKVRNTGRFMLGNLYDFDPETDCVYVNLDIILAFFFPFLSVCPGSQLRPTPRTRSGANAA